MHPLLDGSEVPDGVSVVAALLDLHLDRSTRCLTAGGELDCANVGLLAKAMTELIDIAPGDSSVDIGNVTFIGARLGCRVHFDNQLDFFDAKLSVTGATSRQRWLFELVGLRAWLAAT